MSANGHTAEGVLHRLAGDGRCSVQSCPCGCIHLNVGPATLRITTDMLHELARVLAEASSKASAAHESVCLH